MINARAPGKVVLWGEYAVLIGAPAAVLAIDRYASCRIEAIPNTSRWQVETRGFASEPIELAVDELLRKPQLSGAVLNQVLQSLPDDKLLDMLPAGASVTLDTEDFQLQGQKLGIGSSAAICTASYVAFATLLGVEPNFDQALAIHQRFQGKQGSGIDVAAAWHGGSLRYQAGSAQPLPRLNTALWQFLWTGTPAKTGTHLQRFKRWTDTAPTAELDHLAAQSAELFDKLGSPHLVAALGDYVDALRALDGTAELGIYGPGHEHLHQLALDWQVVYKPCGAGGGDVGAVISDDANRLAAFTAAAANLGFVKLAITRADHGVQISS
jgi:phosphomevalonate kinase